jgi:hypothetical protein
VGAAEAGRLTLATVVEILERTRPGTTPRARMPVMRRRQRTRVGRSSLMNYFTGSNNCVNECAGKP